MIPLHLTLNEKENQIAKEPSAVFIREPIFKHWSFHIVVSNNVTISVKSDHSTFSVRPFRIPLTIALSNKIVPSIQPQSNVKGCLNSIISVEFKGEQVSRAAI